MKKQQFCLPFCGKLMHDYQYITIFAQPELNNQTQPKLNLGTSDVSKYMQSTVTKLNSETTSNVKT